MCDILRLSEENQRKAWNVISEIGIIPAWESIGAEVRLVGSLKTGLLMKHLDIDFHIYTKTLNISESFRVAEKLAENPAILRMEYRNDINTDEHCIEWHAWYTDSESHIWQIDMIQILKGSYYDGYFEHIAQRVMEVLTPETRLAILKLKMATPMDVSIMGIEYYQAVLQDGIRSWDEFQIWRKEHPVTGIIEWCP